LTNAEKKRERREQTKMANVVARHLGVKRQNSVLFPAIAKALGRMWVKGKHVGYQMVEDYARREGLTLTSAPKAPTVKLHPAATDAFLLSFEWRRLRMVVIKKRGAKCECCGATPADGTTVINVDHVKPRRLFPELALDESNLQVLCNACNHGKGNWDQTDWRTA
jgi:hypothetical protein